MFCFVSFLLFQVDTFLKQGIHIKSFLLCSPMFWVVLFTAFERAACIAGNAVNITDEKGLVAGLNSLLNTAEVFQEADKASEEVDPKN